MPLEVVSELTRSSAPSGPESGEQPRALADDHGIDDKVELVDQVIGEQPSEEDTAAGHKQVALLLRFQITDGHGDVAR